LDRDFENFQEAKRSAADTRPQGIAIDELGSYERGCPGSSDLVNCQDVRVIQRRGGLRFLNESLQASLVGSSFSRKDLDRDCPTEFRIKREVDLPHPSSAYL
jgi:hypothetical protein